jgi:hypothetical protein
MVRSLKTGEALFFSKQEAEIREISCDGDGVWAKLGLFKGRGPSKQWNVVFEDTQEKWMMDTDIYAFVTKDTRGQIEAHSSGSENERRQQEADADSEAAGSPAGSESPAGPPDSDEEAPKEMEATQTQSTQRQRPSCSTTCGKCKKVGHRATACTVPEEELPAKKSAASRKKRKAPEAAERMLSSFQGASYFFRRRSVDGGVAFSSTGRCSIEYRPLQVARHPWARECRRLPLAKPKRPVNRQRLGLRRQVPPPLHRELRYPEWTVSTMYVRTDSYPQ